MADKQWIKPLMESAASTRLDPLHGDDSASSELAGDLSQAESAASPNRTVSDEGDATRVTKASTEGTPRALRQGGTGAQDEIRSPSEPQWSNDMSPFQAVQAELQDTAQAARADGGVASDYSAMRKHLPDAHRIRLRDLPPDSPDTPQFETMTFKGAHHKNSSGNSSAQARTAPGGGDLNSILLPSEPSFAASMLDTPGASRPHAAATHSARLDPFSRRQIAEPSLAKASPMKPSAGTSSGPAAGQQSRLKFPADLPKNWNGIADLSTTGLTAFPSPMKAPLSAAMIGRSGGGPSSGRHLMSSPGTALMNASTSTLRRYPASPAPSMALSRTPAKEAARRIAESVYDATGDFDSPEMPSAIKNANTTRLFDFHAAARGEEQPGLDSPSQNRSAATAGGTGSGRMPGSAMQGNDSYASQPSFVQRSPTQLFHHQVSPPVSTMQDHHRPAALADFGGGTTANIDDLLAGSSVRYDASAHGSGVGAGVGDFAGIVNDDEHHERPLHAGMDDSFTGDAEPDYVAHRPTDPTFTEYDEAYAQATGCGALRLPGQDGPEDTLFGMPAGRGGVARTTNAGGDGVKRVAYSAIEEDDTFTDDHAPADGGRSGFRLHGLDDMATLHGGELLSSGALLSLLCSGPLKTPSDLLSHRTFPSQSARAKKPSVISPPIIYCCRLAPFAPHDLLLQSYLIPHSAAIVTRCRREITHVSAEPASVAGRRLDASRKLSPPS